MNIKIILKPPPGYSCLELFLNPHIWHNGHGTASCRAGTSWASWRKASLGTPKASARALCAALCTWVLSKVESVAWQGASVKKGRHLPRKILRWFDHIFRKSHLTGLSWMIQLHYMFRNLIFIQHYCFKHQVFEWRAGKYWNISHAFKDSRSSTGLGYFYQQYHPSMKGPCFRRVEEGADEPRKQDFASCCFPKRYVLKVCPIWISYRKRWVSKYQSNLFFLFGDITRYMFLVYFLKSKIFNYLVIVEDSGVLKRSSCTRKIHENPRLQIAPPSITGFLPLWVCCPKINRYESVKL